MSTVPKPYVGQAPILDEVPASTDFGQLVRHIGPVDAVVVNTVDVNVVSTAGVTIAVYDIEDTTPGVIYTGRAPQGSATSAAVWEISRTTLNASGNPIETRKTNTTAIWDARTSETYT